MSRGFVTVGVGLFSILSMAAVPRIALAEPVCLVSLGLTLYRVNGAGPGVVETYSNQPGTIIGMTLVPSGVTVAGCAAGDVLAVEEGDGGRFWRVDAAACGTPLLAPVGRLPATTGVSSIAFAHGQLYGIGGGGVFRQFDPNTFAEVGTGIHVTTGNTSIGGLAYDGSGTWYITNGGDSRLYRFPDPPTAASWFPIGDAGLNYDKSGLEMYAGQLWGALRVQTTGHLLIGAFDVQTGHFSQVWDVASGASLNVGFVAFAPPAISRGDINCDGHVDAGDVSPFVLALTNPPAYVAAYPGCGILNADMNGDCSENGLDIQPFVNELVGS